MGDKASTERLFERYLETKKCEKYFYDGNLSEVNRMSGGSKNIDLDGSIKERMERLNHDPDLRVLRETCIHSLIREKLALSDQLISLMKRLPRDQKDVLFCLYYKGMTTNEVAAFKNKSTAWVRMQKQRAFAYLDSVG